MTRKDRRQLLEGVAVLAALVMLVLFVVPSMINLRDSVAFVVAVLMLVGAGAWVSYYIYRLLGDSK